MNTSLIPIAATAAILAACGGTPSTGPAASKYPGVAAFLSIDPDRPANYANPSWPAHYDAQARGQDNAPATNPVTDAGAALGRVLFHDRRLSLNDQKSCAACHAQATAFSDTATLSRGFDGTGVTGAHSMRLANARFYAGQDAFWDRRAASLEAQATQPIRHPVEMGFDAAHGGIDSLIRKMGRLPYYPELFRVAFGDATITEDRIQRAVAQYVRSIVSTSSRFDQGFAQVYSAGLPDRGLSLPFPGFTTEENRGKQLFIDPPPRGGAGCVICHTAPTLSLAANSRSNGLDAGETRVFKSPSLKNVAVTGPYMHDGRFRTLDEVIQHYINGVQDGPALDNRLRRPGGLPQRLPLDAADRAALVAFLRTLTDASLAADSRFADPFVK